MIFIVRNGTVCVIEPLAYSFFKVVGALWLGSVKDLYQTQSG